jgi:hypothetical protein
VPRQPPFTLGDIKARERLGLGPIAAPGKPVIPPTVAPGEPAISPYHEANKHSDPSPYEFSDALECLRILSLGSKNRRAYVPDAEPKRRHIDELTFICRSFELTLLADSQETPARKAEAFQRAIRWCRRWERGYEHLTRQRRATKELRDQERLPQALEQEAVRRQVVAAMQEQPRELSREDCFAELQDKYRREAKRGLKESHASLSAVVHTLQDFACGIDPTLTWRGGKIQPTLIAFIEAIFEAVLKNRPADAVRVRFPEYARSPKSFRRLMRRHPPEEVEMEVKRSFRDLLRP